MRLSSWFWKRITAIGTVGASLFIAISCANDSSLNVTKVDSKTMYVTLESEQAIPDNEKVVLSGSRGVEISHVGNTEVEIPSGQEFALDAKLPAGWEIESWKIYPGGVQNPGTGTRLVMPAAKSDQHLLIKVRRIPFLRFEVKVIGQGWMNRGGGMVSWTVFPPGTDINNFKEARPFWVDSGYCNTINGFSEDQPRVCDNSKSQRLPKGYPNGTVIQITLEGRNDPNLFSGYRKELPPFVMTDHYSKTFNFLPDLEPAKEDEKK